jgi:succinyl-CoA synthetase beta subunit
MCGPTPQEMLGRVLVTHQTGPKGKQVNRLYIEEGAAIAKEFYLSLLVDRETSWVSVVASTEGGMDIEDVAHDTPEKIHTFGIDPATGVWPTHNRNLAKALGLTATSPRRRPVLGQALYEPSWPRTWPCWRSTR